MTTKRFIFTAIAILVLFGAYCDASRFMIAKAIAPPNASAASILRLSIHHRFEMATPHRSLFTALKLALIPSVKACGIDQPCDGTNAEASCGDCEPGYCYCPGCQTNPGCTPYYCIQTNKPTLCQQGINVDSNSPCYSCETDNNVHCTSTF